MSHITATLERCMVVICTFQVSDWGSIQEYYDPPSQTGEVLESERELRACRASYLFMRCHHLVHFMGLRTNPTLWK